jgi:predicted permease
MSTKVKFWFIGIFIAAIGLVVARIISPLYAERSVVQLAIFLTGVVVAMAGLGVIILGIRKQ